MADFALAGAAQSQLVVVRAVAVRSGQAADVADRPAAVVAIVVVVTIVAAVGRVIAVAAAQSQLVAC